MGMGPKDKVREKELRDQQDDENKTNNKSGFLNYLGLQSTTTTEGLGEPPKKRAKTEVRIDNDGEVIRDLAEPWPESLVVSSDGKAAEACEDFMGIYTKKDNQMNPGDTPVYTQEMSSGNPASIYKKPDINTWVIENQKGICIRASHSEVYILKVTSWEYKIQPKEENELTKVLEVFSDGDHTLSVTDAKRRMTKLASDGSSESTSSDNTAAQPEPLVAVLTQGDLSNSDTDTEDTEDTEDTAKRGMTKLASGGSSESTSSYNTAAQAESLEAVLRKGVLSNSGSGAKPKTKGDELKNATTVVVSLPSLQGLAKDYGKFAGFYVRTGDKPTLGETVYRTAIRGDDDDDDSAIIVYLFRDGNRRKWGFAVQVNDNGEEDIIITDNLRPTVKPFE